MLLDNDWRLFSLKKNKYISQVDLSQMYQRTRCPMCVDSCYYSYRDYRIHNELIKVYLVYS